jgi:hypothetical protein
MSKPTLEWAEMLPVTAMALFCEDIREEKGDVVTLVGILPDTLNLETADGATIETGQTQKFLSKLCLYVRINFDPDFPLKVPRIRLVLPKDEILSVGEIGSDVIEKAKSEAAAKGHLLAGVISRAVLIGFRPPEGTAKVEVEINGETYLAGALTFMVNKQKSSA